MTKVETVNPGKTRSPLLRPTVSALRPPGAHTKSDARVQAELSRRRSRIARPAETNGGEAA